MREIDVAALRLDRAIDALLRGEQPGDVDEERIDADGSSLAGLARSLHEVLPRFHPRFGFEDTVAARLTQLGASGERVPAPIPIPFPVVDGRGQDARRVWDRYRRELVAGGAIASGVSIVIPLAGAALVKWRRSRSSSTPGGLF